MLEHPKLSLCIPTYNRAGYLEAAVISGLREADSLPPGLVEVLISDNASTDGTPDLVARLQAEHPALRAVRAGENGGFDRNYLRCMEEARGDFVWILGDDDEWMPGCAARVLEELDAGADACICLSQACDLALNPVTVLPWYLDANPPRVWRLDSPEDLVRYFDACARNAAAFAFISVAILRRKRFLLAQETLKRGVGTGYVHLWGMMAFLRQPARLHYVPEPLVRNRMSDLHTDSFANIDLFGRWRYDLIYWAGVADGVFGDLPEVNAAFSRVLGRNHHNTMLPGMRKLAHNEAAWLEVQPYLVRAGFLPVRIAAVDFAYQHMYGGRLPMAALNPATLCLVDLPLVARGAKHIALLALGGLPNIIAGADLLATLRNQGWAGRIRIFCNPECAELLDGFELQELDPDRYAAEVVYREAIVKLLVDFTPELVVNLDPERRIQADDLVTAVLPAGAIAYELPRLRQNGPTAKAADQAYTCLLPAAAGSTGMLEALGLRGGSPTLWPIPAARAEALAVLQNLGWDPGRTLALLVDHAAIAEDPMIVAALASVAAEGWTVLGIGGRSSYGSMEQLLAPFEDRAVNLAGVLSLGSMAALLPLCGAFLGGTAFLRSVAEACGCAPLE